MAEGTAAEDGGPAGGRWVDVAPDRLARWVASFAERHGAITAEPGRRPQPLRLQPSTPPSTVIMTLEAC